MKFWSLMRSKPAAARNIYHQPGPSENAEKLEAECICSLPFLVPLPLTLPLHGEEAENILAQTGMELELALLPLGKAQMELAGSLSSFQLRVG